MTKNNNRISDGRMTRERVAAKGSDRAVAAGDRKAVVVMARTVVAVDAAHVQCDPKDR